MAIQFNCPSCAAMIRVPDSAGGKKGTCPRCGEKLLVPDLATAAGADLLPAATPPVAPGNGGQFALPPLELEAGRPAPVSPPPAFQPPTVQTQPTFGLPALGQVPALETPDPATGIGWGLPPLAVGPPASVGLELKQKARRQKQVQGAWIVPVVCALGLIAFLGWFLWNSAPKLEGELTAQSAPHLDIKPGLIPGSASGLSAADRDEVLRHLRAEPAHWTSSSSKITLTGTSTGVEVSIRPGTASHFVGVQPLINPAFLTYVTQHAAELDKPRLASITEHAPKLFAAWQIQFSQRETLTNQKDYRDLVAMPTLVTGVGYHLEAVVNGNIYPCVYEDSDGQVYFLLPNATKSFQLKGRRVAGGSYIPANLHVKISGTASTAKKTKSKTQEERESEDQGMDPDGDNDLMNDEMPERSKPKKGVSKKAISTSN